MYYKKTISGIICTIFIVIQCLIFPAFGANQENETFTLRVGYWPGYGMEQDETGKLTGYTYDYINEIAQFNHWNVTFIPCNWDTGMDQLARGELDLFGPLEWSQERAELYDYPSESMGEEYGALYIKEDNHTIYYEDAQSLDGKVLGTMSGNYFSEELNDYCVQNQISLQIKVINDGEKLSQALTDGTIDLMAAGSMQLPDKEKVALHLNNYDFFYPTTKGNQFVLDGLNKALENIQKENIYYNMGLYNKHYTRFSSDKKAFTAEEAAFIHNAPVLRIGYESTGSPIEFYDKKSKTAQGISIDLIQKISEYSGLQFEFVPTNSIEEALSMIERGEIQLVSNLAQCDHFTELYGLKPTNPILTGTLVFIVKQETDLNTGSYTLALPQKWVSIQHHIRQNYPDIQIKSYPDIKGCMDALENGQANLGVMNTYTTETILKEYRYRNLTANSMRKGNLPLCLGISPETDSVLCAILNKSIASIDTDTRNQVIYQHTISLPYQPSLSEMVRYSLTILCIGSVLFVFFVFLFSVHSRKELNRLAFYDPLTGEMNLNKFKLDTQKLMNRSGKTNAIMVIDINKFKSINDLYGYEFGDRLLVLMAKALRKSLPPSALLCHANADRFDLFIEYKDEAAASEYFNQIARSVTDMVLEHMPRCNIVLRAGVCMVQPEDTNISSIIDRANIARMQVKNFHKSSLAFYTKSMLEHLNQTRTIENNMMTSLNNHEFVVYLQPKIELTTNQIAGAEALVRWQHPEKGLIPPNDFIPLFEENGFIVNLDFYMLEQVCILLERWKCEGRKLFTISVNLSRRHLFHADTAQQLCNIVAKYDVDPSLIEVELTESAFDNCDILVINKLFDTLHGYGFTVSVDDFGAGYSSLSLLKDLPIDVLKIDKSFFECSNNCKLNKMDILLESVISLSRKLDIKTVSEGVETEQQVNLLLHLGCDLVQGFYFARPMPILQLETILESSSWFPTKDASANTHENTQTK